MEIVVEERYQDIILARMETLWLWLLFLLVSLLLLLLLLNYGNSGRGEISRHYSCQNGDIMTMTIIIISIIIIMKHGKFRTFIFLPVRFVFKVVDHKL